jgi:hypothetical protein
LEQLRAFLRRRFFPRRPTALVVAIVAAFAARPLIGDAGIAPIVFRHALLVLLLVALYTIQVDELVGSLTTDRSRALGLTLNTPVGESTVTQCWRNEP